MPGIRQRLKITVSHINIFRVLHILDRFVKIIGKGIILQRRRKGVRQLSGRIHISAENIRHGKSAFHSTLPCQQHRPYFLTVLEPDSIHHTANIQDNDYFPEVLFYRLYQLFFTGSQIKIAFFKNTRRKLHLPDFLFIKLVALFIDLTFSIPAFPRESGNRNNSRIRVRFCRFQKSGRHFRLPAHTRHRAFCILPFHFLLIKAWQLVKQPYLSFLFLYF